MASLEVFFEDLFFDNHTEKCPILEENWQHWYQQWFNLLNPDIPKNDYYELSLRLTNDQEIKILNGQFRNKNEATDVLSFASLENETPKYELEEPIYLGDIIISVETAKKQAQKQQHSLKIELSWLACHGFLHLLGWDHPDDQSLAKMLQQQEILLGKVNII